MHRIGGLALVIPKDFARTPSYINNHKLLRQLGRQRQTSLKIGTPTQANYFISYDQAKITLLLFRLSYKQQLLLGRTRTCGPQLDNFKEISIGSNILYDIIYNILCYFKVALRFFHIHSFFWCFQAVSIFALAFLMQHIIQPLAK